MIVRCDAIKNYMFLRDSQLVYGGWIVIWGSSHELYVVTVFVTGARLNNLISYNSNGMTNSEIEMYMWK